MDGNGSVFLNPTVGHECRRCGTCCRKGGPTLHRQDLELVSSGRIPAETLVTLRKGELAWDPIRRALLPLQDEIIKAKSKAGVKTCRFLAAPDDRCEIYSDRPQECRILTCWDVGEIEAFYEQERLTRRDLLHGFGSLWTLIQTHEARCSVALLSRWARRWHAGEREASADHLAEIIRFDSRLRRTVVDGGVDAALLDFLFGRPLTDWFEDQFGIRVSGAVEKGPFPKGR